MLSSDFPPIAGLLGPWRSGDSFATRGYHSYRKAGRLGLLSAGSPKKSPPATSDRATRRNCSLRGHFVFGHRANDPASDGGLSVPQHPIQGRLGYIALGALVDQALERLESTDGVHNARVAPSGDGG